MSIHPSSSTAYLESGRGGNSSSREPQQTLLDFDLSHALESSTESEENAFESGTCICMGVGQEEMLSLGLKGLDLTDSDLVDLDLVDSIQRPISMKGVALFAAAVIRMKPAPRNAASGVLEDNIVRTSVCLSRQMISFRRFKSLEECTLCDTKKKNLVRSDKNQLLASTLQAGCSTVKVKRTRYLPSPPNLGEDGRMPVVFTIVSDNTQHRICCSGQEPPVLKLEACSETKLKAGDMDRFLFYVQTAGKDLTSFESVKHPGWFISTSNEENQPVQMCQKSDTERETDFKVI